MARLWSYSSDLQTVTIGINFTAITTNAPAIETTIKRSGNSAFRVNNVASEGLRNLSISSQGSYWIRFYIYIVALPTAETDVIGGFMTTGTTRKISIRITSGGALQLYNSEDSAQVGTDSSALSLNTWYRIEVFMDSTTLASTSVEARAYADTVGASMFWNPSGTVDMSVNPVSVYCGGDGNITTDIVYSDVAINDSSGSFQNSWCGAEHIIILRANGAGDNTAWTRGGTDTGANWSQTSEVPPDTAQYVESNTSGQIDDYEMDATPSGLGANDTINVVHVGVYAAVSDATSTDPDIVLRIKSASGGTVEESASLDCNSLTYHGPAPLPANDNYQLTLYDLPGASTSPWTKATLDTMQAGIREAVTDAHFARVAALWVVVGYTEGSAPSSIVHPVLGNSNIQDVVFGGNVVR